MRSLYITRAIGLYWTRTLLVLSWLGRRTFLATLTHRLFRRSDSARWQNDANLLPEWDGRNRVIAELVPPHATVIEFGAGRQTLRTLLPPGCKYIAVDIVQRDSDTIVCDLNTHALPQLPAADIAVFSGVLEYLHDVPHVLTHSTKFCRTVIVSYVTAQDTGFFSRLERSRDGWFNHYSLAELLDLFSRCGLQLDREARWQNTHIFRLSSTAKPVTSEHEHLRP